MRLCHLRAFSLQLHRSQPLPSHQLLPSHQHRHSGASSFRGSPLAPGGRVPLQAPPVRAMQRPLMPGAYRYAQAAAQARRGGWRCNGNAGVPPARPWAWECAWLGVLLCHCCMRNILTVKSEVQKFDLMHALILYPCTNTVQVHCEHPSVPCQCSVHATAATHGRGSHIMMEHYQAQIDIPSQD